MTIKPILFQLLLELNIPEIQGIICLLGFKKILKYAEDTVAVYFLGYIQNLVTCAFGQMAVHPL